MQSDPLSASRICPSCSTPLPAGGTFCLHCGTMVKNAATPVSPQATPLGTGNGGLSQGWMPCPRCSSDNVVRVDADRRALDRSLGEAKRVLWLVGSVVLVTALGGSSLLGSTGDFFQQRGFHEMVGGVFIFTAIALVVFLLTKRLGVQFRCQRCGHAWRPDQVG